MSKERKYVWIVTTTYRNITKYRNKTTLLYFSSKEKANLHIEWAKMCAVNNGAEEITECDNVLTFKIPNGDFCIISLTKDIIDADDMIFGEA